MNLSIKVLIVILAFLMSMSCIYGSEVVLRDGLKLKVITKNKYTVIHEKPDNASEVVHTVGQFNFLYVFANNASEGNHNTKNNGFYLVGSSPNQNDILGYNKRNI